jgi:hypothetical protein
MLTSGATSAWLIYDMTTATKTPSLAVAILQYRLLACALIGLAGFARFGEMTKRRSPPARNHFATDQD